MPISFMPLPYAHNALYPAISAETLEYHHGKHHKGYVDKVNAALAGTPDGEKSLEEVIASAREGGDDALFNNAAQAWNHGFYWASLSPLPTQPSAELADAIARDFGSHEHLVKHLLQDGAAHFASGWIWLASDGGTLSVVQTHDAETLADAMRADAGKLPLLVIDLWEHAYYLDRKNARDAYLGAVVPDLLNWAHASQIYAARRRWSYPG